MKSYSTHYLYNKIVAVMLCFVVIVKTYLRISDAYYSPVKFVSLFFLPLIQWSYGVTCWEIFSLGRIPYPAMDNVNIIGLLKSGKRLEQPELCPSKM